jgi:Ca2+-binding RTX toxin-like protein
MTITIANDDAIESNNGVLSGAPAVRIGGKRVSYTNKAGGEIKATSASIGAIELDGDGSTIVNESGAWISGLNGGNLAIRGSAGVDTISNAGRISGLVQLGDGNDSLTEHSTTYYRVDLGAGDDLFESRASGTYLNPTDGGTGYDRVVLSGRGRLVYGRDLTGFERLEIGNGKTADGAGGTWNLRQFSGFQEISLAPGGYYNFVDSVNLGLVTVSGASFVANRGSYFGDISGSALSEQVYVASARVANVSLGGGDDYFFLERDSVAQSMPRIDGTVDGGAGSDTVLLNIDGGATVDLSNLVGFEHLNGGSWSSLASDVRAINANNYLSIYPDAGGKLTLAQSYSPLAEVQYGYKSVFVLESTATVGRIGSYFPWVDTATVAQQDNFNSYVIAGTVLGAVHLGLGHDSFDSSLGSIGGAVYGYAGDDVLKTGAGAQSLYGGYGNDVLDAGAGDDYVEGGEGNDTITVTSGADTVHGGNGTDTLIINYSGDADGHFATTLTANLTRGGHDGAFYDSYNNSPRVDFTSIERFVVTTGAGNDVITTGNGDDVVDSGSGSDTVNTGGGNDIIKVTSAPGSTANGSLNGGSGFDTLDFSSAAARIVAQRQGSEYNVFYADGRRVEAVERMIGGLGDDLFSLGGYTGPIELFGGAGNDILSGGDSHDFLYGEAGDDQLFLTPGDHGDGGDGNDHLNLYPNPFTGVTTAIGGAGIDIVEFNGFIDVDLQAGTGTSPGGSYLLSSFETVIVNVFGIGGNYIVRGSDAAETFSVDPYWDGGPVFPHGQYGFVVFDGRGGDDRLTGGRGHDQLSGGAGNDTLTGAAGHDLLDGGTGADAMTGGEGDDVYIVDGGDTVTELASEGTDEVRTALTTYTIAANVENFRGTASGPQWITGNHLANTIVLGDGNDTVYAASGNDIVQGNGGNDWLHGGVADPYSGAAVTESGNDRLEGGAGDDTLTGWDGNDLLYGGSDSDYLDGGAGDDVLWGDAGDDIIITGGSAFAIGLDVAHGGDGADNIFGEQDRVHLYGEAGNDTLIFGAAFDGMDIADGGEGFDTMRLRGNYGQLTLSGANINGIEALGLTSGTLQFANNYDITTTDSLVAADASLRVVADSLQANEALRFNGSAETNGRFDVRGGLGADTIVTGAGNDLLNGGAGNDALTGGLGNDVYVVDSFGDTVTELAGEGVDEIRTALGSKSDFARMYVLPANFENLTGTSATGQGVQGNALNNVIALGAGGDLVTLDAGGDDQVSGGGGSDYFYWGAAFTNADRADGGAGNDTLALFGSYTLAFDADDLSSIEKLALFSSGDTAAPSGYTLTMHDANVAAGQTLMVVAQSLAAGEVLSFNGAAELDGTFSIRGGKGADTITGGAGSDVIWGNLGADMLRGGKGLDLFDYNAVAESKIGAADTILDFTRGDRINLGRIDADGNAANGDTKFTYLGDGAFTGAAGELRVSAHPQFGRTWVVEADVDGDKVADLTIYLVGPTGFLPQVGDFIL